MQEHCKFPVSQNNELIGKLQRFLEPIDCYQEKGLDGKGWGEIKESGGEKTGGRRGWIEREEEEVGEGKLHFDEKTATAVRLSRKWILIGYYMSYSGTSPVGVIKYSLYCLWDSIRAVTFSTRRLCSQFSVPIVDGCGEIIIKLLLKPLKAWGTNWSNAVQQSCFSNTLQF